MSGRPLELHVYPYVDRWVEVPVTTPMGTSIVHSREMGYERPDGVYDFTLFGPDLFDKRLTDAELAAEYHASMASANFALSEGLPWADEMARHNTVCRFATHPHYDET